jgi:hypothetical protein
LSIRDDPEGKHRVSAFRLTDDEQGEEDTTNGQVAALVYGFTQASMSSWTAPSTLSDSPPMVNRAPPMSNRLWPCS